MAVPEINALLLEDATGTLQARATTPYLDAGGNPVVVPVQGRPTAQMDVVMDPAVGAAVGTPDDDLYEGTGAGTLIALLKAILAAPIPAGEATIGSVLSQLPGTTGAAHGTAPATLLSVLATIPVNASRVGFWWQNQSAAAVQIVLDHDTSGTNYSVILSASGSPPGGSGNVQGDNSSFAQMGIRHTGQIRICGAAGSQVAAGEY